MRFTPERVIITGCAVKRAVQTKDMRARCRLVRF